MSVTGVDAVRGTERAASEQEPGPARRSIARRRNLPSGRAVVGALLVTISGLGLYAANRAATAPPTTKWLVARHDIPAGHRIVAADLGLAAMRLIDETAGVAYSDPAGVIGHLAVSAIAADELIQHSDIATRRAASGEGRRLTLDLSASQALDGDLAPGDLVDIAATGADPGSTQVIVADALVSAVDSGDRVGVGSRGGVRVTIVVASTDAAQVVIDSAEHGKVNLLAAAGTGGTN